MSALTDREMAKTAYTFLSKLFNGGGRMAAGGSQFLQGGAKFSDFTAQQRPENNFGTVHFSNYKRKLKIRKMF